MDYSYSIEEEDNPTFLPNDYLLNYVKENLEPDVLSLDASIMTYHVSLNMTMLNGDSKRMKLDTKQLLHLYDDVRNIKKVDERSIKLHDLLK